MAELLSSLHSPGAQERTVTAPFGEVPVAAFARYTAFDGLVHGWDLSRATGLPYEPPDDLVAEVDAFARQFVQPEMRDGDTFAGRDRRAARCHRPRAHRGLQRPSDPHQHQQEGDTAMSTTLTPEDIETIKGRQQATWSSGDYAVIGTTLQIVGESLCEAVDVTAGSQVLDVAAGNGNVSLAAARRGCAVTATDYVEALLEGAQRRADAEGLPLTTRVADAENLPFEDDSFDTVLSTFGVMFVPNPDRAAEEMLRVTRSGGRIGLANWTPTGFIGRMFKIVGAHVPPPAGVPSPLAWGTEERLAELFGADTKVDVVRRHFVFRYDVGRPLLRDVQDVLRADPQGLGCARRRGPHVVPEPARRAGQ